MRKAIPLLMVLLALSGCKEQARVSADSSGPQPQALPTTRLKLGDRVFTVQIADEVQEQQTGLMYRKSMSDEEGMIFCFPSAEPRGFWMKNTPIDLDIIYVGSNLKIVSIKTMRAYSLADVPSDGDAQFAIELNAGMAKKIGLSVGQILDIPADLRNSAR